MASVLLVSCDGTEPTAPETPVADGPWTAPIPADGRLLEPGDAERGARRGAADASAYGCLVSTLRADGSGPAYDYDAVYVHFPDRLVREAEGRVVHATFALRSEKAPAHAATRFDGGEERGGVVRVARCRLPESVEAGSLVKRALQEFRAESWLPSQSAAASSETAGGAAYAAAPVRTASMTQCAQWVEVWWCQTVSSSGGSITRCEFESYECTRYVSVSEDPWDGGDPPGSGDDPDPCPTGPTDQLCDDGGGAVPPPSNPPPNVPPPPPAGNDVIPDTTDVPPDCSKTHTVNWARDYCNSRSPNTTERSRVDTALNNIEARGGVCEDIAAAGRALLSGGQFRFYTPDRSSTIREERSAGGYGHPDMGVYFDEAWPIHWHSGVAAGRDSLGNRLERNFEQVVAHEIDHYRGLGHSDETAGGFRTLNSGRCSGLADGLILPSKRILL